MPNKKISFGITEAITEPVLGSSEHSHSEHSSEYDSNGDQQYSKNWSRKRPIQYFLAKEDIKFLLERTRFSEQEIRYENKMYIYYLGIFQLPTKYAM